jgi:anti-sigma factor RsiW
MNTMNHISQDDLVLHYYGELAGGAKVNAEQHLNECSECKAEFSRLGQILSAVNEETFPVPPRADEFEARVWASIKPQLSEHRQAGWKAWFAPQRLVWAGALSAVIIVAFMAGRISKPPVAPVDQAKNGEKVRERIVLVAVGDHLEKSQMMLVELVNAEAGKGGFDLASEQERARDLLTANRLYQQSAQKVGDPAVNKVLEDLERVLVEVANSPSDLNKQQLADLQQQIESQGLLFRVRVLESKVNSKVKEQAPARPANNRTTQRTL